MTADSIWKWPPAGASGGTSSIATGGKEKRISLGVYPEVSLKDARERREAARKLLAQGVDPSAARKEEKAEEVAKTETFEFVAREWHQMCTGRSLARLPLVLWLRPNALLHAIPHFVTLRKWRRVAISRPAGRKEKARFPSLEDDQLLMFLMTRPKPRWANRRAFPEVRPGRRAEKI